MTEDNKKRSQMHLQQCANCREESNELDSFYGVLVHEMRRSVSPTTFSFIKKLSSAKVKSGLVVCEPLPQMNNGHGQAYRTKLHLDASSGEEGENGRSFNVHSVPKHTFFIRLMTDLAQHKIVLALWSLDSENFRDWILYIPGISENVRFNSAGLAKIPAVSIEKFDDKVIYIRFEQVIDPNESRLQKILKSVIL